MEVSTQQLGRYTLLRPLASGGMGEIYLAETQGAANFTKRVAIKRILPHLAKNPDFVEKFIDEANVMVQLHHGNIVPVLELGDQNGDLYLVMEYLPGRDLKALLQRLRRQKQKIPIDLALWLVSEVCAGLDYAHRKTTDSGTPLDIVHRDVSPSNICLGSAGEVKLVDFGIARAEGRLQNSISGSLQGKFVYMSPEQAEGGQISPKSDIFSLGLVLYELLCGSRPFEGESDTETLRHVRTKVIDRPSMLVPTIPSAIDELIMTALARSPNDRFDSAGQMGRAINRYLAMNDSEVGADTLARFLAKTFTEGVLPANFTSPRTIDDALKFQLDALTPSVDKLLHTQTGTGPQMRWPASVPPKSESEDHARLPGRPVTPTPLGLRDSGSYETPTNSAQVITVSNPTGRKRSLTLGLLLGLMMALALFTWLQRPQERSMVVNIEPIDIEGTTILVDGVPYSADDTFVVGRLYTVCVSAPAYRKNCERFRLTEERHTLRIALSPQPTLHPVVTPATIPHRILVDRVQAQQLPMGVELNRTYIVCVEADGHTVEPLCHRVVTVDGMNAPRFTLTKEPIDTQAVSPAPPLKNRSTTTKASTARPDRPTKAPIRPMQKVVAKGKRPQIELRSFPTAQVWLGAQQVGSTPLGVDIGPNEAAYELRAKGYANTRFVVTPTENRSTINIPLLRPGYITLRVFPPATEIWLDGVRVGKGYLSRFPTEPGRHTLEFRYYRRDKLVKRHGPVDISVDPGEVKRLQPFVLREPPKD